MGDGFFDIQPTNDGNFIAVGTSGSWDMKDDNGTVVPGFVNYLEAWVVKIDPNGNFLNQKLIGGRGSEGGISINATSDGGYIFAGSTNSTNGTVIDFTNKNHGKIDGWVVKLYPNLSVEWHTLLGGSDNDELVSVREAPDGYIVTGFTTSTDIKNVTLDGSCGETDIYVAKLDREGTVVWQKVIGGSGYDTGSGVALAPDGGYVVAGYTDSHSFPNVNWGNYWSGDIVVTKLDSSGNHVWTKRFGGGQGEATAFGNAIHSTKDGYILIGQTLSSRTGDVGATHGSADVWVVKLDESGNIKWQNLLGGTGYDDGTAIQQTSHGDYILAARTASNRSGDVGPAKGPWDIWVAKLNSDGKLLWQDVLGGSGYEQCTAIQPTSDEGFILAAYTESSNSGNIDTNHGYQDGWLAKLKPRLLVDVEDSDSHSWVPNTTVFLHDIVTNTDTNHTALINGRVVFTGYGESEEFRFMNDRKFTVRSIADNYKDSLMKNVTFTQDGWLVNLSQTSTNVTINKSFSITCIENYDHICGKDGICALSGSFDECDNVASALISAGYKMNFYHKDDEVTEKDFATDSSYTGDKLTDSAFHYHTGHGTNPVVLGTYLNLKDSKITWLPGIPPIPVRTGGFVDAGKVEKKWGGKTKWVAIQSCNILKDENWGKALTTAHGILGYSTPTGVNSSFSKVFLDYALDKNKKMTIVSAYKQATIDSWYDDNITAKVIARTKDQYSMDQFPGVGNMASDAGPNDNNPIKIQWKCRSGVEW